MSADPQLQAEAVAAGDGSMTVVPAKAIERHAGIVTTGVVAFMLLFAPAALASETGNAMNDEYATSYTPAAPQEAAPSEETGNSSGPAISGLFVLSFAGFLYFIPSIVAKIRQHQQSLAVFILNLFLGWTCLGWVIALVWACTAVRKTISL